MRRETDVPRRPTHTCIGVDALGENSQRQQWIDECEQAGRRGVGGEQGGGVSGHDAVGNPDAAGHGLHGDGDAEVSSGAVTRQTNPLCCGA